MFFAHWRETREQAPRPAPSIIPATDRLKALRVRLQAKEDLRKEPL
jgi:hypothetical protein